MISLKQFMGWDTVSTHCSSEPGHKPRFPLVRPLSPQFQGLSKRLFLTYLGTMAIVVGISATTMYEMFAYSLFRQLDEELDTLGNAAAHNLPEVLANQKAEQHPLPQTVDDDGDLDLPWQDIHQDHQSIEWFNHRLQRVARSGKRYADYPLENPAKLTDEHFQTRSVEHLRSLTIPVYSRTAGTETQTIGYVRVTESIEDREEALAELLMGMTWGGLVAVGLIGITGWWLTRRSLHPVERSFRQLQQFTADASHELRSPLTAVQTTVEVMKSHPERIHPADVKKLEAIAYATHQMTQLVEDLLLLARTDAPVAPLRSVVAIPLTELLEDLVDLFQSQALADRIALSLAAHSEEDSNAEVYVQGDADQLKRLFVNLLENALQYTPAGGSVSILMSEGGSNRDYIDIYVRDNGIGIAPEHLPLVFDRFWRADQARSRRQGGSGLGLAIAQAIVHAHKGTISVSSELAVGTCFQVRLPIL